MYQNKDQIDIREIKRGEIYYIDLSNIDYTDSHISGKSRPGLIIQNNIGNDNSYNVIVALLTGADKKPYPFQYKLNLNGRSNTVMFDQIMTVSKQNLENKLGELTAQQIYESDIALMCSLNLLSYSIMSIQDFDISSIVIKKTKNQEMSYCNVDIISTNGDRENKYIGKISISDLSRYDALITQDSDLDEIKDKLNNCAGLNFLMNHLQF